MEINCHYCGLLRNLNLSGRNKRKEMFFQRELKKSQESNFSINWEQIVAGKKKAQNSRDYSCENKFSRHFLFIIHSSSKVCCHGYNKESRWVNNWMRHGECNEQMRHGEYNEQLSIPSVTFSISWEMLKQHLEICNQD